MTSVVAFAVAILLLAALVLVNRQKILRRRRAGSILVSTARAVGQTAAFVGAAAGFWHIQLGRRVKMVVAWNFLDTGHAYGRSSDDELERLEKAVADLPSRPAKARARSCASQTVP